MIRFAFLVPLLMLLLAGCGPMPTQNTSGTSSPVNAIAEDEANNLLLNGADVAAYFTQGAYQAVKPEFGGYCANGIVYGIPWGGDADTWKIIDGKLYFFGGQASRDAFKLDEANNLALAQQYWTAEIVGQQIQCIVQASREIGAGDGEIGISGAAQIALQVARDPVVLKPADMAGFPQRRVELCRIRHGEDSAVTSAGGNGAGVQKVGHV